MRSPPQSPRQRGPAPPARDAAPTAASGPLHRIAAPTSATLWSRSGHQPHQGARRMSFARPGVGVLPTPAIWRSAIQGRGDTPWVVVYLRRVAASHRRANGSLGCVCVLLVVTVVGNGCSGGSRLPPDRRDRVGRALDALIATGVPGAVVFVRDGRRTILLARGDADTATFAPMGTATQFRVASITKAFVAAVVLQLVAEGRLSLDEPVDDLVAGLLPRADSMITVR